MRKTIPSFKSDEEAERFVETADLSEYDLSGHFVKFELRKKDRAVSLRLPEQLYEAVKQRAQSIGIPYQRFIRMAIENALRPPQGRS